MQDSVLITGGSGFIGSHLAEALLQGDIRVSILDSMDDFYSPALKRQNLELVRQSGPFDFYDVDIRDRARLETVFQQVRPQSVIHLAARAGVRPSIAQPVLYQEVNVGGTSNLLELSRQFGAKRFIFGSSSSVYGSSERAPFREDDVQLRPISPYAATKLAGELIAYTYAHLFQLEVVALRFFTVYGPRQRPDLAIRKFLTLLESGKPLPIFGDGSMGRDYTFIADIVAGIRAALEYRFAHGVTPFEIFNLGNSSPIKLRELIAHLEAVTGHKAQLDFLPQPPGDVPLTWADISKAKSALGYEPQVPFRQGLSRFVDWYRSSVSAAKTT